ncbi:helix-turn-helix domain-containing protein [Streptomyces sp. NPDC051217]|uniref:helix-turn-helix domain-containing protein n=1 Tax=Streptomyces sp. NPDC051217 TaxID=3365644 RepID=UPI0037A0D1CF
MGRSEKIPAETAEFAKRLRALKERTDRSYGSLATQLHLGASTLHRYCHGHALPVDYAPVERLAKVVGATPAERVELHRLWLRAHSARTEEEGDGIAVAETVAVPVAEPEPVREPEPDREPEPAPHADGGTAEPVATPDDFDPVPGSPADDPDPSPPAATTPPMSRPRASRLRRRQIVGAALAVVTVLGGTVIVAADLGKPDSGSDRSGRRLADPGPDGPVDPPSPSARSSAPSAKASASKSGDGPKASPSGSVGAGKTEAGGAGGDGGRPGGKKPGTGTGPAKPLVWTADSHKWQSGCAHTYLINRAPTAVPPPPNSQDARQWATALGAVHGDSSITQATLNAAAGAGPVVVQEVFVRVVGRRAPLKWNAYEMSNGCGGAITPAVFTVDLDASRPIVRPVDGASEEGPLPAPKLPYQVTASEPLVLKVEASTDGCDCDWYLEVRWTAGDRTGVARIDDAGRPFRTSASGGGVYGHDYESGKWMGP